jgi:hypothetical protein
MCQSNIQEKVFYKFIELLINLLGDGEEKIQNYIYDFFRNN